MDLKRCWFPLFLFVIGAFVWVRIVGVGVGIGVLAIIARFIFLLFLLFDFVFNIEKILDLSTNVDDIFFCFLFIPAFIDVLKSGQGFKVLRDDLSSHVMHRKFAVSLNSSRLLLIWKSRFATFSWLCPSYWSSPLSVAPLWWSIAFLPKYLLLTFWMSFLNLFRWAFESTVG